MRKVGILLSIGFLLMISLSAGGRWETVGGIEGGPLRLVGDSVEPQLVWGHSLRGVFISRDGGSNWSATDSRLLFPRDIVVLPTASGTAYTTNGLQVFRTRDAGRTWRDCSANLNIDFGEIDFFGIPLRESDFLPQIADGAGIQSRIFLWNLAPAEDPLEISFRDEEGNPVEIDIKGHGPVSTLPLNLQATQFQVLRTSGQGDLRVASAQIRQSGLTTVWTQLTGPSGSTADRPAPTTASPFRFPARLNAGEQIDTGIALHNTSEQSALLALELLDAQNQSLATAEITLAARGRISLLVSEIDWQSDLPLDFSDFLGSLRVVPEREVAVTVIQVRPGTFGKIPVAIE